MKARLKIQDFGPIQDLDIKISKFNILIGPHASGKSTIAKIACVIHTFADYFSPGYSSFREKFVAEEFYSENGKSKLIKELFSYYRIESFLKPNSYFFFEDDSFSFEFTSKAINIIHTKRGTASRSQCYYIPPERIALPMISESLFELTLEQSTLPRYFLQFGRDFTLARKEQRIFNLPILNVEFEYKEGKNFVVVDNSSSIFLEEASSAIQANLPLLVILQHPMKMASLFVVEELELHNFPTLQKELLSTVINRLNNSDLSIPYVLLPTHSPYILSAANNLLFAAKVAKQSNENAQEVDKIISKNSWINKDEFSAYFIANGTARSIVDEKTGLVHENELDSISEDLAAEFDALMELYKPVNA